MEYFWLLCVTREIRYEAVLKAGTGDTAPVKLSSVSLEKKIDTTEEMICPLIRPQLFTLSLHKISYYEEKRKIVQPEGILCFYPVPEVVCVACLESLHHRNSWIS